MSFRSLGNYALELTDLKPGIRQLGAALIMQNLYIYSKKQIHKESKKPSHLTPPTIHKIHPYSTNFLVLHLQVQPPV